MGYLAPEPPSPMRYLSEPIHGGRLSQHHPERYRRRRSELIAGDPHRQRTGAVGKPYQRDLLAWLRADVDPDAPLESVPQLLVTLMERMTSPLDQQKTAAEAGFSSREAFGLRLQRLVNSHALLRCRHRLDDGRAVPRAQAKLYLTDPLLAWLPSALSPGLPRPGQA
jgi:uncharacterized protein